MKEYKRKYDRWERQFFITRNESTLFGEGYREGMKDAVRAIHEDLELPVEIVRWLNGEKVE